MKKFLASLLATLLMVTLVVPAMAAPISFVPSIELSVAPDVIGQTLNDGSYIVGEIVMPDGTVISVPTDALVITPLTDADVANPSLIGDQLKEAYQQLLDAESLEKLIPNIREVLAQVDGNLTTEELVVSQLFHVYLPEEYSKYLDEGGVLSITFDVNDDVVVALMNNLGKDWTALFGENWVDNGDGTITVKLSKSCVIAFMKSASSVTVDPENPDVSSPTTSDSTALYAVMFVVFMAASVAFAVSSKKQKA